MEQQKIQSMTEEQTMLKFFAHILTVLKGSNYIRQDETDIACDRVLEVESKFAEECGEQQDLDTAIYVFDRWWDSKVNVKPVGKSFHAGVTIRQTLGDTVVEFSFGAEFDVNAPKNRVYDYCIEQVKAQFAHAGNTYTIRPPNTQPSQLPMDLTFNVSSITIEQRDGKRYAKAKGGKFDKFGVRVWPEVLAQAGLHLGNMEEVTNFAYGELTAHYSVNEKGLPVKVEKLDRSQ